MRIFIIIVFACLYLTGYSQSGFCGTTFSDEKKSLDVLDQYHQSYRKDAGFIYVPLMIHNLANDKGQGYYNPWNLFETLCTLNEDFKPSGLQFFLENDFNYINNSAWNNHAEFYIGEDMMHQSNVPNMANCYLVANPAGNCGYFTYNGDGVALSKSCLGKRSHTWAHELGHYFSLPHTFFGWEGIKYSSSKKTADYQTSVTTSIETVDRDLCKNQADRFCDTEPDYISDRWTCTDNGYSSYKLLDTKDSVFRVDGSLFMSYANDDCMSRFSGEQMDAMNKNYQGPRSYLKRNNVIPKFVDRTPFPLQFPNDSITVPTRQVIFSWNELENAKYYVLQISRTDNFSIIIETDLLEQPYAIIDSLIQGKNYWWRVRAYSEFDFCGTDSKIGFFKTVPVITSTENQIAETNTSLTPNPVSSYEFVQLKDENYTGQTPAIIIHDLNGKIFKPKSIITNQNTSWIELSFLPDGFYYINLQYSNYSKACKMIVKNK